MVRRRPESPGPLGDDPRRAACRRKRRYPSQGAALDAAMLAGVERQRSAYQCPLCHHWHLTGK